ncbi:MAG TPA: hypothetical protein ENJ87_13130, partial [Gammaproteobacteria bacterium]|nr:hypothetical protein [Gammaproteobacteria bacterium]
MLIKSQKVNRLFLITLPLIQLFILASCNDGTAASQSEDKVKTLAMPECRRAGSDWLFCADFDGDDDLTQWDTLPEGQSRTLLEVSGPAGNGGNRVLQLRIPPGMGGRGLNKTFSNGYDKLYARWYVYYEEGFDFTVRNHGHGFHAGDRWKKGVAGHRPKGDDWFTVQLEHGIVPSTGQPAHYLYAYYRGMSMDCTDPDGSCWGDMIPCTIDTDYYCKSPVYRPKVQQPPLVTGRWYCLELMVDAGDAVNAADDGTGSLNF